jgi:hypothetical protein
MSEPKYVSEETERLRRATWRDPLPYELDLPEFNAIWDCIKEWDIGTPFDITIDGAQLYSGATGNHVVAILDALRGIGLIDKLKQPEK